MTTRVSIQYPVDALVSYHYFRDDAVMTKVTDGAHLRLIGDSGAYSAHVKGVPITVTEYARWCHRWGERLMWRANLDVIGDPAGSLANWRLLRDHHGVDTVPTIHVGTDPAALDPYATAGVDFIGLGGMVGKPGPTILRWSVAVLRHARTRWPHLRFHAWGQAGQTYLNSIPVYSADSSRSSNAYRFGMLRLFDPATGTVHAVKLNGSPAIYRHGRLLRTVYGVEAADIRTSHAGNRRLLIRLAAAQIQQYAAWLGTRHRHVSAPVFAMTGPAPAGPRIHHVSVAPEDYVALQPDAPDIT